ncbi:MAG: hypothetical protein AAF958_05730 [Planctomycetota bacterium]
MSVASHQAAADRAASTRECKPQVLASTFLELRAKLLEVAAGFDRLDLADGSLDDDGAKQLADLRAATEILLDDCGDAQRAARLQKLFSRPYDPQWREVYGL